MKSRLLVLFVVTTLSLLVSSKVPDNFPYQAHSFDSLDYIKALLKKNVKWFKIDIQYATRESCLKHSTWDENLNACETWYNGIENLCCLSLKGDMSGAPFQYEHFDTTYDLIDFLYTNKELFQGEATIVMAMDFDSMWTQISDMVIEYLYLLAKVIKEENLNLFPILTKLDPALVLLQEKCEAGNCTPKEQYVYDFNFDNASDTVNHEWNGALDHCVQGFPESKYPYRLWEPSHQDTIQAAVDVFLSPFCKIPESHRDLYVGLRVTSNLELEQFQVFLAQHNKDTFISSTNKAFVDNIEFFRATSDFSTGIVNVISQTTADSSRYTFSTFQTSDTGVTEEWKTALRGINGKEDALISMTRSAGKLLAEFSSVYKLWKEVPRNEQEVNTGVKSIPRDKSTLFSTIWEGTDGSFGIISVLAQSNEILLKFSQLGEEGLTTEKDSTLLMSQFDQKLYRGGSVRYVNSGESVQVFVMLSNYVAKTDYSELKLGKAELDLVKGQFGNVTFYPQRFDIGTDPNFELIRTEEGEVYILEIHTDGLCQCGLMTNNMHYDKCLIPTGDKYYYTALMGVPGKVNYNWGRLADFVSEVETGSKMGGCNPKIFHAKLTSGYFPYAQAVVVKGEWKAMFLTRNMPDPMYLDEIACGVPLHSDTLSIYFNSFDLVSPDSHQQAVV